MGLKVGEIFYNLIKVEETTFDYICNLQKAPEFWRNKENTFKAHKQTEKRTRSSDHLR
jgi:hypothetical protein